MHSHGFRKRIVKDHPICLPGSLSAHLQCASWGLALRSKTTGQCPSQLCGIQGSHRGPSFLSRFRSKLENFESNSTSWALLEYRLPIEPLHPVLILSHDAKPLLIRIKYGRLQVLRSRLVVSYSLRGTRLSAFREAYLCQPYQSIPLVFPGLS